MAARTGRVSNRGGARARLALYLGTVTLAALAAAPDALAQCVNCGAGTATGANAMAWGTGSTATGLNSTATGVLAHSTGNASTATGLEAQATGDSSTATGSNAWAIGVNSTATGQGAFATGDFATATGRGASASGTSSTANGAGALASGDSATATGRDAWATGALSTATGQNALATGANASAYGQNAQATGVNPPPQARMRATGGHPLRRAARGDRPPVYRSRRLFAGDGHYAIATGYNAQATADTNALGQARFAGFANSTAIGQALTRANQVSIGSANNTYTLAGLPSAASNAAQSARSASSPPMRAAISAPPANLAAAAALDGRVRLLNPGSPTSATV